MESTIILILGGKFCCGYSDTFAGNSVLNECCALYIKTCAACKLTKAFCMHVGYVWISFIQQSIPAYW